MKRAIGALVILAGAAISAPRAAAAGRAALDFDQRVDCQRRVEGVYHRLRAQAPTEAPGADLLGEPVPREVLERRVDDSLRLSAALGELWQRPLGPAELQAEIDRMARATKRPTVLRQLFAALDDDPYLIAECLARPILVRRLARGWYAGDDRFHGAVRGEAERSLAGEADRPMESFSFAVEGADSPEWAADLVPRIRQAFGRGPDASLAALPDGASTPLIEEPTRFVAYLLRRPDGGALEAVVLTWPKRPFEEWWSEVREDFSAAAPVAFGYSLPDLGGGGGGGCVANSWSPTANDNPDPRDWPTAVWTGAEMIVWGGQNFPIPLSAGARYDPATDTWTPTSTVGAPPSCYLHTAVWTGSRMILWGGINGTAFTNTGAIYDPAADSWTATSTGPGVPDPRSSHTAVWTGTQMIVWGGGDSVDAKNSGARYTLATDSWTPLPATSLAARNDHTAVWTGTEMIVWGGEDYPARFNDGARYNPTSNSWTALPATSIAARYDHTAVWTGSQMIVWGGNGSTTFFLNTGARYTPATNSWTAVTTTAAPGGRYDHTAVWTGSRMIVWGGLVGIGLRGNTGGLYDPVANTWTATSTAAGTPQRRMRHSAVWTGTEMIVWGGNDYGFDGFLYLQSGGRYNPGSDSWVATAAGATVPEARRYSSLVWTGAEMIAWGGFGSQLLGTGGRYDPALDDWTPTATGGNAPSPRIMHSAVWTGDEMIVWGGSTPHDPVATGARYDPALDSWTTTSTVDAPSARAMHAARWTGREMVVVGRSEDVGRYTPSTDSWAKNDAPAAMQASRIGEVTVWTGGELLLWGGQSEIGGNTPPPDGGRYDPRHDSWQYLRGPEDPPATREGSGAWTGDEMVVWGGVEESTFSATGARFDPATGGWSPISVGPNAPTVRRFATAVWTGEEMIVWGGITPSPSLPLATGARFDPATDSWSAVSTADAPTPRQRHGAIFTDQPDPRMIVWGGLPNMSSGAAYCAPCTSVTWYRDLDGDGHGDSGPTTSACTRPVGYSPAPDDCDDADPDRFPGNPELCADLKDNDCNSVVDDAAAPGRVPELYITPAGFAGADFEWAYAAAAEGYDVTRGSIVTLVASGGDFAAAADDCLANDAVPRSASDPDGPPAGDAFWYVVRGVNCAGNGSYDSGGSGQSGSRDPGLSTPSAACP